MKRYQIVFVLIFLAVNVLAQTQSGTQSGTSTQNMEKTLGTSEDVLPPSPNPAPPVSQDTKKSLPKIEKQDVVIIGKDRSKIEHEEQRASIEKQPGSVNVPAIGVLKTETSEILSVPNLPEGQTIKPSSKSLSISQTPIYSFSVNYGSRELLSYDFSHSREVQKKGENAQRFSYCFGVQREKSDGFHHGTVSSPFGRFSTDGLNGEGVIYFKDYSVRTGMSYFSRVVTLPYSGTQTSKLEKGGFADYDIRIPGGAALTLGMEGNKYNLFKDATANNVSGYLKFTTPFTANTPPIAIGSIISNEKVTREGTSSYDRGYYSLYAESRYIKISNVNLDVKVAVDGYKTHEETTSQVDYLIAASYPWKHDTIFQMNMERKLSLPGVSESYVHEDYTSINSMLKPQSSTKIRVSGNWCISQDVCLGATIFMENISDYISWGTATDNLYEPINIGDVKLSGIELRLQHNLTKKLVQSISLINTTYKNQSDNNKVVPYIPDARLMIGLKYVDNKNLSVSLDGEYIGERYAFSDDKNKKLKSYFLVNLTANKRINDTLSCTFDWENLLSEEYEIRDGYYGNPTTVKAGLMLRF